MLPHALPAEIGLEPSRLQVAFDLLQSWTDGPQPVVPGGAIIVGRHGKTIEPRFFGKQGPEATAPNIRRDAIFLLASITKPITYLAAMMLVERGLLGLSDPVTQYIPDFAAHHKDEILVQHLFTHVSGLPDMVANNTALRREHAPLSRFTEEVIRNTVPLFRPGTDFKYQSMGTLIAAEIVQRLSGLSIQDFIRREILEPLGLRATSLGCQGLPPERLVRNQTPATQEASFDWNSRYWRELGAPWGGMFSSPEDFAVLCQLMLNGGRVGDVRLLSPITTKLMTTNRLDDHPDVPEPIRRAKPWGLGWQMNHPGHATTLSELLSRAAYGHIGSTGTLCWIDPEANGFCLLFTSYERDRAPWRLVHLANAVASAFL